MLEASDATKEPSEPSTQPTGTAGLGQGGGASIVVSNLCKYYRHAGRVLKVLDDVSFSLEPGERVAIVGASGAGKSTLLQLLGALDVPTSGSITIGNTRLDSLSQGEQAHFRNRHIGFVFQFHHLLNGLTALENVMLPWLIRRTPKAQARSAAEEFLCRVGLKERMSHRPTELSGGEQQRVALARAMVMKPALLLADEPTGNLDPKTAEEIQELFIELNREQGSTVLVVTHNEALAKQMPRQMHIVAGGNGTAGLSPTERKAGNA